MKKDQRLAGSIRQIAEALAVDRSILARLIADRRIKPASHKSAHPTYHVRDCAEALRENDPERESAHAQLARARAARERLKFEQEAGRLLTLDDAEREFARVAAEVARVYD